MMRMRRGWKGAIWGNAVILARPVSAFTTAPHVAKFCAAPARSWSVLQGSSPSPPPSLTPSRTVYSSCSRHSGSRSSNSSSSSSSISSKRRVISSSSRHGLAVLRSSSAVSEGQEYGANQITVLEGLEPVRKRPGMYIGSSGTKGLHHLVYEVIDNSIDEALAGHCDTISVSLEEDGSVMVSDNGRGIPCDVHERTNKSALETVMTVLHAGGKFGGDESGYKVSGGLHGVGISVVNALSEALSVEVRRDGKVHSLGFAQGKVVRPLEISKSADERTGTAVRFKPDREIFKTTTTYEWDRLADRFDELAYLNAGVSIVLTDNRTTGKQAKEGEEGPRQEKFLHKGGLPEYVELITADKTPVYDKAKLVIAHGERDNVQVEAVLCWSADMYTDSLQSFANGIRTADGGSHLDGLKAVVTRTINAQARKAGKIKESGSNIGGEFVREGLTAVVNVKVPEPEFEGQTKNRLGNPEVRGIVDSIVGAELVKALEWNPKLLAAIVDKASFAQQASAAAKAARDIVRRKSLLTSTVLPGKLADCSSKDPAESEIYIVEGDSAAGSAKQGRDRYTQAILPLRGKILNIEKAASDKIYQNTELQALISALGLGIRGIEFDPSTLRYHRIIIMTDADVDGSHIRILLLTFLFRYQRELVEKGYIYIACPPLYKTTIGKKENYTYTEEEQEEYLASIKNGAKRSIQRFKGLGEMMPKQLWNTTMDPEKRTLKLVTVDDAVAADKMFSMLMGDNVAPRKEFINRHADMMTINDLDF